MRRAARAGPMLASMNRSFRRRKPPLSTRLRRDAKRVVGAAFTAAWIARLIWRGTRAAL